MKKNRKLIIAIISVFLLILLFLFLPTKREMYDDGGTVIYRARLYTLVRWNRYVSTAASDSDDLQIYQKTIVYWYPKNDYSYNAFWTMELLSTLEDRVTDSRSESVILEEGLADYYGVYPSDELQFALYTTCMEIDHSLTVSLNTITQYDENGETIYSSWIECSPEIAGDYTFTSQILSQNIEDGKISLAGLFKIMLGDEEIVSEHITLVQDSVF